MSAIYLKEATLAELLAEIANRFDARGIISEWAAPVVFAVAAYYGVHAEDLRGRRREDHLTKLRHLTIALLAKTNAGRTRAEVCAVLGLGHEMYTHALAKTDERCRLFPEFAAEVKAVHKIIIETTGGIGAAGCGRGSRTADLRAAAS